MESTIKPTVGRNVYGCIGIFLGILLVIILLFAFAVAKTGLVQVPVFSRLYHGPTPTRLVSAQPMSIDAFRVLLASRFVTAANSGNEPPYVVTVSEKELTGALMGALQSGVRESGWKETYTQAVVRPDKIEVFIKLENGDQTADLLAGFVPRVESGGVRLEPVSFRFGDYPVPVSLAERIVGVFFNRDFGFTTIKIGEAALTEVRLLDGSLEIVASPTRPTP